MASKKKIIDRLKMELWVMDRIGICKDQTLRSREVQDKQLTAGLLTIGEARLVLKLLGAKPSIYRGSEIIP